MGPREHDHWRVLAQDPVRFHSCCILICCLLAQVLSNQMKKNSYTLVFHHLFGFVGECVVLVCVCVLVYCLGFRGGEVGGGRGKCADHLYLTCRFEEFLASTLYCSLVLLLINTLQAILDLMSVSLIDK